MSQKGCEIFHIKLLASQFKDGLVEGNKQKRLHAVCEEAAIRGKRYVLYRIGLSWEGVKFLGFVRRGLGG
jgi:hypothetical protein